MKSLIVIASVLFSLSSFALPKAGQWATSNISLSFEDGSVITGTKTVTVLEVHVDKTLVETVFTDAQGTVETNQDWAATDEIMSDEDGQAFVDQCATSDIGGVAESVTVVAGTFDACRIGSNAENGIAWISAVPFGIVDAQMHGLMDDGNGNEVKVFLTNQLAAYGTGN